jgi:hypothetical protein
MTEEFRASPLLGQKWSLDAIIQILDNFKGMYRCGHPSHWRV